MRGDLLTRRAIRLIILVGISLISAVYAGGQTRVFSGVVVTPQFELLPDVTVEVDISDRRLTLITDREGAFRVEVPTGPFTASVLGKNISEVKREFTADDRTDQVVLKASFAVPPISESVTIEGNSLEPAAERQNDAVYKNSLFQRDDQLIFTLNAGINAGQHEGGGKSLEIRRFGFNTDHGGVNGGVKIMVDNFQQNQGTQGHGQGYLGSLKSLSPELVEDVEIINGPFSAAYGDFSGLGVVQIRLKGSLPERFTARIQAGSHNTVRGFFAYSPSWRNVDAFVSYEPSYTDGPFENPLRYRRDNFSGNLTRRFGSGQTVGVKFNFGRSDFVSSGQIPLDLVADGTLDRFGAVDPDNGGKVRLGTVSGFYRREWNSGTVFKADAFVGRSLFDLFSNFTFFLADPIHGDEIQQHDSRLQEGVNVQFIKPFANGSFSSVLTAGGGLHLNQVNVGLYPSIFRDPRRKFLAENIDNPNVLLARANAKVNNLSGYIQNTFGLLNGHLRIDAGLRFDYFAFDVSGFELGGLNTTGEGRPAGALCNSSFLNPATAANPCALILDGSESGGKFQPKLGIAWSPSDNFPITVYGNYGRGISSQDARGVVRNPSAPKSSTTDFYQAGASYNGRRLSLVFTAFLIDRSSEQVYIPDDGSIEFAGRSRSYGIEVRNSIRFNRFLSFNGGLTQVIKAFYPGQFTEDGSRLVVDSAPHTVANAGLIFGKVRGFDFALNWRYINSYRLDGDDPSIMAAGHDVVDFSLSKRLRRWIDLNFAIDNLLNKKYYETQNYFESRVRQGEVSPVAGRIHATPGYPITVSAGVTFRFGAKK